MYDETKPKTNASPGKNSSVDENKLLWTSSLKSNVSSLGEKSENSGTGLYSFNEIVKTSIKYLYLNSNNFSNIDVLADFPSIIELQCQCNPNLVNVNGIENHINLSVLALQSCSLSSIGSYQETEGIYLGGITGCNNLGMVSIQNNSSLDSLVGIEDSKLLKVLVANNCNITNIDSLKEHSSVTYLDLANNVNLERVKNIKDCKALQYIYLDNNIKMSTQELNEALNSKISSDKETVLISQCLNSYKNIPKIYWDLFYGVSDVIDFSYGVLGEYLTDDSPKWIGLMNKTNIKKLNLMGQNKLSNTSLQNVLSTLSGMVALRLDGVSNLTSVGFLSGMKNNIYELNICNISNSCTDLSILNSCSKLNRLFFTNSLINFSSITTFIKSLSYSNCSLDCTWNRTYGYLNSGLIYCGSADLTFPALEGVTTFVMCGASSRNKIDLSGITSLTKVICESSNVNLILPKTVTFLDLSSNCNITGLSFVGDGSLHLTDVSLGWMDNDDMKLIGEAIGNGEVDKWYPGSCSTTTELKSLAGKKVHNFSCGDMPAGAEFDFSGVESCIELYELYVYGMRLSTPWKTVNLDKVFENSSIHNLNIQHSRNGDWSGLRKMTQLTSLVLSDNGIVDISFCENLINLAGNVVLSNNNIINLTPLANGIGQDGKIEYTSLDVSNNSLDGYTGGNNIEALLKLHKAGLQKVTITGNYFTANEVDSLKNGMTISGVSYEGFGSENVIN